MKVQYILT